MEIVALVVGATGIAGRGVSQELLHTGASVHGISRHREGIVPGVKHVAADLFAPASVGDAVSSLKPSHVYLTVWSRRPTEEENIRVNAIAPGPVETPLVQAMQSEADRAAWLRGVPPRRYASPN